MVADAKIAGLRRHIESLAAGGTPIDIRDPSTQVPLSLRYPDIDTAFESGGLAFGSHQFAACEGDPVAPRAFAVMLLARFLADHGSARALIVQEASALREAGPLYGPGLHALGLDPGRLFLLQTKDAPDALRAVNEALRARTPEILLIDLWAGAALVDLSVTRRFNLAAKRACALVLMTTPDLLATSAALTRWRVTSKPSAGVKRRLGAPTLSLDLVRNRHGRTGHWILEWNSHDRHFQPPRTEPGPFLLRSPAKVAAPMAAEAFDRSGQADHAAPIFAFRPYRQAG